MQITMTAELYQFDQGVFRTVTEAFMKQEMTRAVKEFLLAALVRIPQRTGFLRGSFSEIANAFNAKGTGAGLPGYSNQPEYYYTRRGAARILKTPRSGLKFVTAASQVLTRQGDQIVFNIVNTIRYFESNDFGSPIPGTPWGSVKEGLAEMVNYLEGSPGRFPNIESILTRFTVRTTGTSTTTTTKTPNIGQILTTRQLLIEGF